MAGAVTTPTTTTTTTTTNNLASCGFNAVATSTSQPITSPNYPNDYPNNVDCTWTITASDGMRVQLNLIILVTERNYDYLTISSDGSQLVRLSGSHSNKIYRSTGSTLTLAFTSDGSVSRSGFNATFVEYQHVATTTTAALTCGFNAVATSTSQLITSPNYPNNYPNNANCTWTITASDGMRIQLNLHRFKTERNYDYLTIFSNGRQLTRISGSYSNKTYIASENSVIIRFTSDRSVTRSGFNLTFVEYMPVVTTESTTRAFSCGFNAVATSTSQPITSPNFPNNYLNNVDCTWTITASDGMRVQLNLIRFSTETSYDYLTISSDGTQLARISGIYSNRIYTSVDNTLTLRFTSDRSVTRSGFNATFVEYMPVVTTASSCGFNAVATSTSQPITSPNYPNNYPNNVDCTWTITASDGMRVQLNLIRFSTERSYDYLTISSDGTQLARNSGIYSNRIYTSIGNTLTLRFTSDRSVTRTGFNATFVEVNSTTTPETTTPESTTQASSCGFNAVATSTSQPITSPNFPNNYLNNVDCTWTITASDGMRVQLNLIRFSTERSYDYLTISSDGTQLARISGIYSNRIYTSIGNTLTLRFTSDRSVTRSGFNATFVEYMPVVTTASSCGFNAVATSTSQPITSPNYPNNYPNNADCTWTITASDGMRIQLNLISFSTERGYDYLTISSDGTQLARISWIYSNRIYTSVGNTLTLRFTSDRSVTRTGFNATFVEVNSTTTPEATTPKSTTQASPCGFNAVATSTSQPITSPNYPNNYPNNVDCTWTITASDGMRVQLNLIRFSTERGYDYLTISSDGTQLARNSGIYSNRIYTSIGNTLTLRFTSDRSVTRTGFNATFVEVNSTTTPETTMPESTTQHHPCGFNAVATSTSQPITSPNYPGNYPNNVDCTWTITASDGMRVQLNLIRFSTERSYDYLTISSDGTQLARNSGIYSNRIYTSIGNTLTLRFTSDRSVTRPGFNATFVEYMPVVTTASSCGFNAVATSTNQPIISPNYPNNYPNNADCTWTITASDGMRVQLNLIRFSTERSYDYLTISSDGRQLARISGIYSNRIYTSVGKTLTLRFTSDGSVTRSGFNATFVEYMPVVTTASSCGFNAVATSTSQPITSPNYPNNYPNNVDCTWMITASDGMRVQLNLIRFSTERSYDYLTISSDGTQLARISGIYSNRIYTSVGNTLTLRFTSDRSVTRSGFNATFVEVHSTTTPETTMPESTTQASPCGFNAVATSTSQLITSPNYPNNYPNNVDCTWTITASDGMRVQLNLIRFSTERSYDYLTISSDGTQLARNSGTYSNITYTSIGNTLTLRFTSDRSVTRSGFKATFVEVYPTTTTTETTMPESTTRASSCGFNAVATSTSQLITSPNYPRIYPNNADCTWTITASDGMRVQLNLISFLTERNWDYLTISSDGTQLARMSGTYSNRTYTSIGNTLTLRFTSDSSLTRTGFNATFVEVYPTTTTTETTMPESTTQAFSCGFNAVATSTSQLITSPNYPNNYPNNVDCTWTITASDGMRVQLNLIRFLTESRYDYLTISSDGTQLASIAGTYSNRIYTSIGNTLTLRFTSDRSVTRTGFNATFVEVYPTTTTTETTMPKSTTQAFSCGFNAVATSTSQLITSPNYPNNYPNNVDCTWTITASDGMRVQLNLIRFSTERSYDYLTISSDGTQLARNSGNYSNRIYTSIGNTLTLRFTSDRSVTRPGFNATFVAVPGVEVTTEPTPVEITQAIFQDQTTAKVCQNSHTDLMFLLDSSGSVTSSDFQLAANFVKDFITGIDLTSFQVGVMQYSHYLLNRELDDQPYITTEINIGEYTEADPFKTAMDTIQPHGYTTYTAHAVLKAIRVDFPRSTRFNNSCTSKIIVLITDGSSSDSSMLRDAALEAKNLGVDIYAIGVGDANTQELVVLTRPESGTKDKIFQIDQYSSLPSILQGLRTKILS
uniref:CUB and sushi domain-containing protein 1 isoform X2 n=1 Tax=Ciona intestinalis TaxID=7719 RepID=UPI000EF466AE|nr:CUB and sushi domain-containing protein 1 isoform X2 [Ciona intestinalis]|eukprot:XP_026694936.1 CUB and sushi domain-containing protein 1 isoform X2 [Ciona intestinalis]